MGVDAFYPNCAQYLEISLIDLVLNLKKNDLSLNIGVDLSIYMYETLHKFGRNYIVFGDDSEIAKRLLQKFLPLWAAGFHITFVLDGRRPEGKKSTLLREEKRTANKEKVKLITAQLATLDRSQDPEGYRNLASKRDALRRSSLSPSAELFDEFKVAVRENFSHNDDLPFNFFF